MARCAQIIATFLAFILLTSCSSIPPLATDPSNHGPSVRQVVNHINCELASIIKSSPSHKAGIPLLKYDGPTDTKILEREADDVGQNATSNGKRNLKDLISRLQEYHFVSSVLLTLDTTDTQGIYPNVSFLHPFNAMGSLGSAVALGGQLSGSEERNVTIGYSIDLANVSDGCNSSSAQSGDGIAGNIGLADIVADGLTALDSTAEVNVYSSGGPPRPAFDAVLEDNKLTLKFACQKTGEPTTCGVLETPSPLTFSGKVNFSPSSDPDTPGSVTFSGKAVGDDAIYVMTLTGSTIEVTCTPGDCRAKRGELAPKTLLKFTISGSMIRDRNKGAFASAIGYNPTISLVGTISEPSEMIRGFENVTGVITPSSDGTAKSTVYSAQSTDRTFFKSPKFNKGKFNADLLAAAIANPSGSSGSASASVKTTASSSANTTQFGSMINFGITYGLNGGPNWTVTRFKGPGGGSGTNGSLLSATRTQTAILQLTFVPACTDGNNTQAPKDFWQSIPKCNGTQQSAAALTGQGLNYLAASGRGL